MPSSQIQPSSSFVFFIGNDEEDNRDNCCPASTDLLSAKGQYCSLAVTGPQQSFLQDVYVCHTCTRQPKTTTTTTSPQSRTSPRITESITNTTTAPVLVETSDDDDDDESLFFGICRACAVVCHVNHDVQHLGIGRAYCDCANPKMKHVIQGSCGGGMGCCQLLEPSIQFAQSLWPLSTPNEGQEEEEEVETRTTATDGDEDATRKRQAIVLVPQQPPPPIPRYEKEAEGAPDEYIRHAYWIPELLRPTSGGVKHAANNNINNNKDKVPSSYSNLASSSFLCHLLERQAMELVQHSKETFWIGVSSFLDDADNDNTMNDNSHKNSNHTKTRTKTKTLCALERLACQIAQHHWNRYFLHHHDHNKDDEKNSNKNNDWKRGGLEWWVQVKYIQQRHQPQSSMGKDDESTNAPVAETAQDDDDTNHCTTTKPHDKENEEDKMNDKKGEEDNDGSDNDDEDDKDDDKAWKCMMNDADADAGLPSEAVDLHFDKDEVLAEAFGLGLFPTLSTVTYLTGNDSNEVAAVGGPPLQPPTVVFPHCYHAPNEENDEDEDDRNDEKNKGDDDDDEGNDKSMVKENEIPKDNDVDGDNNDDDKGSGDDEDDDEEDHEHEVTVLPNMWISQPRVGKHIVFDGRLLHGAPAHHDLRQVSSTSLLSTTTNELPIHVGDNQKQQQQPSTKQSKHKNEGEDPKNESPSSSSSVVRITFLVNLWNTHRPAGIEPLPEEIRQAMLQLEENPEHSPPLQSCSSSQPPMEQQAISFVRQSYPTVRLESEEQLPQHLRLRIPLPFVEMDDKLATDSRTEEGNNHKNPNSNDGTTGMDHGNTEKKGDEEEEEIDHDHHHGPEEEEEEEAGMIVLTYPPPPPPLPGSQNKNNDTGSVGVGENTSTLLVLFGPSMEAYLAYYDGDDDEQEEDDGDDDVQEEEESDDKNDGD